MDSRIEINLKNAQAVAESKYTGLTCPKCGKTTSEVFFSVDEHQDRYGIWFECIECSNVEHISCGKKPAGFSDARISQKFQELDWNNGD